ncbi:MAG: BON domain-containing protein [Chloroflexota bacterium]
MPNLQAITMPESLSNSDANLRAAILAAFAANAHIAGAGLRVGVLNGVVHLAGCVDTLEKRATAEELVSQVPGVRGVVNRIEAPGAPSPARTIHLNLT